MAKVHAYWNEDNPIETACGRRAYGITPKGDLKEPPLLLISGDRFSIDCWRCIKVWGIDPGYGLWREIWKLKAEQK